MTTITLVNEQNSTGNPFFLHMLCEQQAIQEVLNYVQSKAACLK